jgi:hypothetical protein
VIELKTPLDERAFAIGGDGACALAQSLLNTVCLAELGTSPVLGSELGHYQVTKRSVSDGLGTWSHLDRSERAKPALAYEYRLSRSLPRGH